MYRLFYVIHCRTRKPSEFITSFPPRQFNAKNASRRITTDHSPFWKVTKKLQATIKPNELGLNNLNMDFSGKIQFSTTLTPPITMRSKSNPSCALYSLNVNRNGSVSCSLGVGCVACTCTNTFFSHGPQFVPPQYTHLPLLLLPACRRRP